MHESFKLKDSCHTLLHTRHVQVDNFLPSYKRRKMTCYLTEDVLWNWWVPIPTFLLKSLYGFMTCKITAPKRAPPGWVVFKTKWFWMFSKSAKGTDKNVFLPAIHRQKIIQQGPKDIQGRYLPPARTRSLLWHSPPKRSDSADYAVCVP